MALQKKISIKPILNFSSSIFPNILCAKLHWRRSISNLFLTFTDMNDRVISTFSLGQFSRTKNRRVKLSPATFDSLYFRLHKSFEKKKIRYVILYLRTRVPRTTLNSLVNFLFSRGVLIASVEDRRKSGHGFMRSPKSPRR